MIGCSGTFVLDLEYLHDIGDDPTPRPGVPSSMPSKLPSVSSQPSFMPSQNPSNDADKSGV